MYDLLCPQFRMNCEFSHDINKIQTTKLLVLLRFYFLIQIFAPNGSWFCDKLRLNSSVRFCVARHLRAARKSCHVG